ncbi:MAG: glycosyltransferase [Clostridia bacterium]|nr:glycosyltransferase [Clostridia bacterium]
MTDNIMVSISMVTYNHEDYIRQAVDSVFAQKTTFEFELIVGEDCSTDNTRAVLLSLKEEYGDRMRLVLHETNQGLSRNSASIRALMRGKYSASLEGDNFWTDEYKLQKQFDFLEAHPDIPAVAHDYAVVFADGKVSCDARLRIKKDFLWGWKNFKKYGLTLRSSTVMMRRAIFPVDDEKYKELRMIAPTMGDTISFSIYCHLGGVYVMHDVMAAMRMPGKKDTSSFSFSNKNKMVEYTYMYIDIVRALEKYFDGKYDLSPLIANRVTGVLSTRLFHPSRVNAKSVNTLWKSLPPKVRMAAVVKMIRKTICSFCRGIVNRLRKKIKGEMYYDGTKRCTR